MELRAVGFTMDAADVNRLADFWQAALGYRKREGSHAAVTLSDPAADRVPNHITFQQVPEAKVAKHRFHIDLFTSDAASAVAELTALGATVLSEPDYSTEGHLGFYATVMADPEGGEFCIVSRAPKT